VGRGAIGSVPGCVFQGCADDVQDGGERFDHDSVVQSNA